MSDFDDIIKHLTEWADKPVGESAPPPGDAPKPVPKKHGPPLFSPGDLVRVIETRWPPKTGEVLMRTGMYDRPGFPRIASGISDQALKNPNDFDAQLALRNAKMEHCIGYVTVGDVCTVLSVWFCEDDEKWYYFLNSLKPKGRGWTRCGFRLERINDVADKKRKH